MFSPSWGSALAVIREELNLPWNGVARTTLGSLSGLFSLIHLITSTPSLQDGLAFTYCKAASFSTCYQVSQGSQAWKFASHVSGTLFLKNKSKIFWPKNFKCDLVPCPQQRVLPPERLGHLPLLTTGSVHAMKSAWQIYASESTGQGLTL